MHEISIDYGHIWCKMSLN